MGAIKNVIATIRTAFKKHIAYLLYCDIRNVNSNH